MTDACGLQRWQGQAESFLNFALDLPTVESPIFQRTQIKEPSMYLFTVPNMTCGGCAKSVTKALQIVDAAK